MRAGVLIEQGSGWRDEERLLRRMRMRMCPVLASLMSGSLKVSRRVL